MEGSLPQTPQLLNMIRKVFRDFEGFWCLRLRVSEKSASVSEELMLKFHFLGGALTLTPKPLDPKPNMMKFRKIPGRTPTRDRDGSQNSARRGFQEHPRFSGLDMLTSISQRLETNLNRIIISLKTQEFEVETLLHKAFALRPKS